MESQCARPNMLERVCSTDDLTDLDGLPDGLDSHNCLWLQRTDALTAQYPQVPLWAMVSAINNQLSTIHCPPAL